MLYQIFVVLEFRNFFLEKKKITKSNYILCNGFKDEDYLLKMGQLIDAGFDNCIIMDCDVKIVSDTFLLDYFKNLNNNIVVGGHVYADKPPKNPEKYFHWLYGSQVEAQDIRKRLKNPYESFMTNCFAISKTSGN